MLIQRISYTCDVSAVIIEIQKLIDFVRFVWTYEFKEILGGGRKKEEIVIYQVFIVPVSKNLYFHLYFILHKYAT